MTKKGTCKVTITCKREGCNNTREVYACHKERYQYCGDDCRKIMTSGENNSNWKPKTITTCANCGKPIERAPSLVAGRINCYCNQYCRAAHLSELQRGANNPAWTGGGITYSCDICGTEKTVGKAEYDKYDNHFCGRKCHSVWKSLNDIGANNNFYGKTHTSESMARSWDSRKDYWVSPGFKKQQSEKMKNLWADAEYAESQKQIVSQTMTKRLKRMWADTRYRERMTGENAPGWIHGEGHSPYGAEFNNSFKESIRERDGYACGICGKKQDEEKRALCVHHIDYDKNNLKEENLISLCASCHSKTNTNRKQWKEYFGRIMPDKITA